MFPKTTFGILETIKGSKEATQSYLGHLDQVIPKICADIKSQLTKDNVSSLLLDLAVREIKRFIPGEPIEISNLAGQARFLRGLCATVPNVDAAPLGNPKTEELLTECGHLWQTLMLREIVRDLTLGEVGEQLQFQRMASAMSGLLDIFQMDLKYEEQVEARIRRLFGEFSSRVIEPALSISSDDAIKGFQAVKRLVIDRLHEFHSLRAPVKTLHEDFRRVAKTSISDEELRQFVESHPLYKEVQDATSRSEHRMSTLLLFSESDLKATLGDRAEPFLNAFSLTPGNIGEKFDTPIDNNPVERFPFFCIGDGKWLLADVGYCSFAPLYRFVDCFDTEKKRSQLTRRRDKVLEDDADELFLKALGTEGPKFRSYYLPVGTNGHLAERDLILVRDDCVFVVESKASPLRPLAQRRDKIDRIASDVKKTIQEGYSQCAGVINCLRASSEPVKLLDRTGRTIGVIDTSKIRHYIPIVFLDSYYGLIAADLKPWLTLVNGIGFPWVVDRDTFESIVLKFDTCEKLKSFLIWRRDLHGKAINEDEAVFAGAFLRHGPFEIPEGAFTQLDADYADVFEQESRRRRGQPYKMPPENTGPPVFANFEQQEDELVFKINGKPHDTLNIMTGETRSLDKRVNRQKSARNGPCPCRSGHKFKNCCLPRYRSMSR